MPLHDIDVGLTDEEQAVRDNAHKFADELLRPAGAELDRLADPAQVIIESSVLWKVFEKYRELQFDAVDDDDSEADPSG
jgi:alkylation response protein AidB-like acyl-CoA dehydrogenase